jgi:hypothetical protein
MGTGRDTRNTPEWVEVAWWVPTDTIHMAGGGRWDRIGPRKALMWLDGATRGTGFQGLLIIWNIFINIKCIFSSSSRTLILLCIISDI